MTTKQADAERRNARLSPEEQRRNAAAVRACRAVRRRESKLQHAMKSAQAGMAGMDELIRRLSDRGGNGGCGQAINRQVSCMNG